MPWAEPQAGAVATQSYANPRYGPDGLALLRQGLAAEEVVRRLTEADDGRDERQLGVVDAQGRGATFTGSACHDWAGGRTGPGYAAQGNILVSGDTVDALAESFESSSGPLADRLIDALAAAQAAGGDKRGQQSAALIVVERDGGYAGLSDSLVDLRVDDHEAPIEELRRLYGLHQQLFGSTPREEWLPVDDELRAEIDGHLARLGYERLEDWAGRGEPRGTRRRRRRDRPGRAERAEEESVSGYEVASLNGLESLPGPGSLRWTPLRKHFGITAFGINAYTATEAGQDVVEEHSEERLGHEEIYVVVSGRATFVLDGNEVDVPAGSAVFLSDPKVKRFARAEEPGTTVLAIGGKPGQHDISAWEYFFAAYPKADAGDYDGALAELDDGLAQKPDHPPLLYHRACILSRAGRLDEARGFLDRALAGDPELKRWADEDEDLAPLRVSGES